MPDPKSLRIGDKIKYISRPLEWTKRNFKISKQDNSFLDKIISRKSWQRISIIDKYGNRWFRAIIIKNNVRNYHSWSVFEKTGWIKFEKSPNKSMHRSRPL